MLNFNDEKCKQFEGNVQIMCKQGENFNQRLCFVDHIDSSRHKLSELTPGLAINRSAFF